jgi:DNA transposition AAA+ family ATPase
MERLLSTTFKETAITVIGSPSGAGKTLAAERFSHANAFSIYVYIPEIITPRYLLTILAGKLGLPSLGLPMHVLFESITMQLSYEKRLLVLDEADRLSKKMFEILRDLWHDGKGNVGIAFVGDENLMNKLKQQHTLKDNLIRLMRRVKYHEIMDPLHVDDVSMAFKHAFGRHKIDAQVIKTVFQRFNKLGGFGSILTVIDIVRKFAERHDETPNSEMVEEAIKRLRI